MSWQVNIPVLYYHSVGFRNYNWVRSYHTMDPGIFESQVRYFARKFKVITMKNYWEIRNGLHEPVRNALVLTFDDGFLDNWVFAFPILNKYEIPATIFVSPDFVDKRDVIRPFWSELEKNCKDQVDNGFSGYMSWAELKKMEDSGLVNIESHTKTHTKYFSSGQLVDFHHPNRDSLYITGNLFPEEKPGYITNPGFEKLIPYGYPVFEERSSVNARRVWINEHFTEEITDRLKRYDFSNYRFEEAYALIANIYNRYLASGSLIKSIESDSERRDRLNDEINGAKEIIEGELNKRVEFLCWPHGDTNDEVHQMALEAGFIATTSGKLQKLDKDISRIDRRIGMSSFRDNKFLSVLRADIRIRKEYSPSNIYRIIDKYYKKYIKRGRF